MGHTRTPVSAGREDMRPVQMAPERQDRMRAQRTGEQEDRRPVQEAGGRDIAGPAVADTADSVEHRIAVAVRDIAAGKRTGTAGRIVFSS